MSSVPVAFLISPTWYSCSASSPPSGSASSRVSPMIEFSGVRSSWLTLAQNLSLDSDAAPQLLGLLVQLPVQRDDAAVGLLELLGQLAVQGHHAAVGLLQLGVEQQELFLLLLEVLKRRDEVLVVPSQFFQRGLRKQGRQLLADGT